ncbi:MAG: SRPBCC family protein [Actinomycetota bacterium]
MSTVEASTEVNAPIETVYNQWTQFEDFPRFMEGVKEVRQIDDTELQWRAEIAGKEREWRAKILEQEPNRRIAWTSLEGAENGGVVTFEEIEPGRTRINLTLEYEPDDTIEKVGDALGVLKLQVKRDVERFKGFLEERGVETGAWRGEVRGGETQRTA